MSAPEWLDLAEPYAPTGFREAVEAETEARAQHARFDMDISTAVAEMNIAIADRRGDPSAGLEAAVRLAGLREMRAALPAVPDVALPVQEQVLAALPRPWNQLRVPESKIRAEATHLREGHRGGEILVLTDSEQEVLDVLARFERRVADLRSSVAVLDTPFGIGQLPSRVLAWHAIITGADWLDLRNTVGPLADLVDSIDTERVRAGRAHVCAAYGGGLRAGTGLYGYDLARGVAV